VGASVIVITIASLTCAHAPLLVEVSVSVTLPAAVSAALGVYVAFSVVLLGVNVPDPEESHCPVVVPPLTLPANVTAALLPQTDWSPPALTIATWSTTSVVVPAGPVQPLTVAVTE
jgi:hypothetical protein